MCVDSQCSVGTFNNVQPGREVCNFLSGLKTADFPGERERGKEKKPTASRIAAGELLLGKPCVKSTSTVPDTCQTEKCRNNIIYWVAFNVRFFRLLRGFSASVDDPWKVTCPFWIITVARERVTGGETGCSYLYDHNYEAGELSIRNRLREVSNNKDQNNIREIVFWSDCLCYYFSNEIKLREAAIWATAIKNSDSLFLRQDGDYQYYSDRLLYASPGRTKSLPLYPSKKMIMSELQAGVTWHASHEARLK